MQFNFLNNDISTLVQKQEVRTDTVAGVLGLNNIFTQIRSLFEQIKVLTNKTETGGGISDENIKAGSITNVSTNFVLTTRKQLVDITSDILKNGVGNFSSTKILLSDSFNNPAINKKVKIDTIVDWLVTDGCPTGEGIISISTEASYSADFTSLIDSSTRKRRILPLSNTVWNYDGLADVLTVDLTNVGTVYYRVLCDMSGSEPATVVLKQDNKAVITLN